MRKDCRKTYRNLFRMEWCMHRTFLRMNHLPIPPIESLLRIIKRRLKHSRVKVKGLPMLARENSNWASSVGQKSWTWNFRVQPSRRPSEHMVTMASTLFLLQGPFQIFRAISGFLLISRSGSCCLFAKHMGKKTWAGFSP